MAVPSGTSVRDLGKLPGKFAFNRTLSDSDDKMLDLQGIGWIIRQAVKHSGLTLTLYSKTDDKGVFHLDIDQVASGGYKNWEYRPMNWQYVEKEDGLYGMIKLRSRFIDASQIEEPYLRNGFSGEVINTYSESTSMKGDQWSNNQVWGLETVDGALRYTRHIHFKRGKDELKLRKVYDFQPE